MIRILTVFLLPVIKPVYICPICVICGSTTISQFLILHSQFSSFFTFPVSAPSVPQSYPIRTSFGTGSVVLRRYGPKKERTSSVAGGGCHQPLRRASSMLFRAASSPAPAAFCHHTMASSGRPCSQSSRARLFQVAGPVPARSR